MTPTDEPTHRLTTAVVLSTGVMMNLSTIKARVDSLLAMASQRPSISLYSTLLHGTIGVVQALYGPDSSQERELRAYTSRTWQATLAYFRLPLTGALHPHKHIVVKIASRKSYKQGVAG